MLYQSSVQLSQMHALYTFFQKQNKKIITPVNSFPILINLVGIGKKS